MRKSDICPECRGECQVEYESSSREPKNLMEQERNLIDRYDTWKKANGIPLSKDAMSVLFDGGLTSEQQAWISDFIGEWEKLEFGYSKQNGDAE
jgi:hypothetical protein